jgi:hypothetical protein
MTRDGPRAGSGSADFLITVLDAGHNGSRDTGWNKHCRSRYGELRALPTGRKRAALRLRRVVRARHGRQLPARRGKRDGRRRLLCRESYIAQIPVLQPRILARLERVEGDGSFRIERHFHENPRMAEPRRNRACWISTCDCAARTSRCQIDRVPSFCYHEIVHGRASARTCWAGGPVMANRPTHCAYSMMPDCRWASALLRSRRHITCHRTSEAGAREV